MAKNILLLNRPNLNLLGIRELEVYRSTLLAEIEQATQIQTIDAGVQCKHFQSNYAGALFEDRIQTAKVEDSDAIVINPSGLTHTNAALRNTLMSIDSHSFCGSVYLKHSPARSILTSFPFIRYYGGFYLWLRRRWLSRCS